jgi:cation diffusion facilitator CzcD-associated flavoprotein CzcO
MTSEVRRDGAGVTARDAVIVGAGLSGLYALHHLRELGFSAQVFEAGDGVGGTWYWNRYPGARCDVPSMEYSYGFSPELEQEWDWTEVFPAQEELERYFNHVADRFDLRRDIQFQTRVTAATYDEDEDRWLVDTDRGDHVSARFLVMATGCLSAPLEPPIPGRDSFAGLTLFTNAWPKEGADFTGKRVGLIGTGSSGVQATPVIAADAAHLYVFQRTPSYAWPAGNQPLDPELQLEVKAQYRDLREQQRKNYGGVVGTSGAIAVPLPRDVKILETSEDERLAAVDELGWAACRAWSDVLSDYDANEAGAELYREMVRRVIEDPETADGLSPRNLAIGCKRPILHTDYYETFNLDHVTLVDLRRGAIEEVTPTGIRTAQGDFELDVIVYATGFDAMTGALDRIDIRGRDGRLLRDVWADGARTLLGIQTAGFPNFFTITGPGSPSVLANMVVCAEQHIEWIGACICYMRDRGHSTVEATLEAQDAWVDVVNQAAVGTMYTAPNCNSWYLGDNIPGKVRVFLPFVGGLDRYIAHCERIVAADYEGFAFS